ncbi:hypothetical protein DFH07DRAFT_775225 [Mycena maculata]|uniref:Uncharacterized protein n=1 Tax=Mycena maculata TaxID=230809 RepID=A0AAD7ITG0_9AGAR|nr:hypothetical protein DFH07DRAFT_775225 [Mycena maculata]
MCTAGRRRNGSARTRAGGRSADGVEKMLVLRANAAEYALGAVGLGGTSRSRGVPPSRWASSTCPSGMAGRGIVACGLAAGAAAADQSKGCEAPGKFTVGCSGDIAREAAETGLSCVDCAACGVPGALDGTSTRRICLWGGIEGMEGSGGSSFMHPCCAGTACEYHLKAFGHRQAGMDLEVYRISEHDGHFYGSLETERSEASREGPGVEIPGSMRTDRHSEMPMRLSSVDKRV